MPETLTNKFLLLSPSAVFAQKCGGPEWIHFRMKTLYLLLSLGSNEAVRLMETEGSVYC